MAIIAILAGISIFALQGARESARDARRKGDLETIRSGIELYRSDCNQYPPGPLNAGTTLSASCPNLATYIEKVPGDPSGATNYCYNRTSLVSYELCATLEQPPTAPESCAGCAGSDYRVTNP